MVFSIVSPFDELSGVVTGLSVIVAPFSSPDCNNAMTGELGISFEEDPQAHVA
jgi:hypothetical protein